ncbi:histidine kinase [Burkholderia cenocepacia]|uniref:PIN-like domain-containing protein n=1 Tax=Burkholderia cenocepacia TaxID=95486 RepID=UPI000F5BD162|nr:PIN-like domain-containing protein [Burkholderia cenocepacia]RQV05342.1 histidine kinase [Burkholderia cenocepacia]
MLDVLLRIHRDSDDIDFASLWEKGIFVFDANVLLDLYRLPETASNDLISVLRNQQLQNRIWIAFQVIVEFLSNRHEAISDQKNKFHTVRGLLEEASTQLDEVFEKLSDELAKLKLKQRHSLINPEKFITPERISTSKAIIYDFLDDLAILEAKQTDVNDRDQIKDIVLQIFEGKIGDGFNRKELDDLYKIAEKRYENNIPPGYKDKSKTGSYAIGDRELVRKFGDLILWKEIIRKVSQDNIESIVLVTGDIKEDWWVEKRGKKLGPRKELLNEIYTEAPSAKTFYMYDTASFLRHAKSHLKVNVQDSSINQAKDLIEKGRRSRVVSEEGYLILSDWIRSQSQNFEKLRVGIGRSVHVLPPIKLDSFVLLQCLMELFSNVIHHGAQNYVGVQAKIHNDVIALRFKNKIPPTPDASQFPEVASSATSLRGKGLPGIAELMTKEGISVSTINTGKHFVVEFHIPKSKFLVEIN